MPNGPIPHIIDPERREIVSGIVTERSPVYLHEKDGTKSLIGTSWISADYQGALIREDVTQNLKGFGTMRSLRELVSIQTYLELPAAKFSIDGFTVTDSPRMNPAACAVKKK